MATLQYDFKVVGLAAVSQAFASLERRAKDHNDKMARMFSGSGPGRGGSVTGSTGGSALRGGVAGPRAGPQQDSHVREFNRMRAARIRNDAAVLREESTRNKNWINLKNRLNNDRLRVEDQHADKQIKSVRRMEQARVREAQKSANARERIYRSQQKYVRNQVLGSVGSSINSLGQRAFSAVTTAGTVGAGAYVAAGLNAGRNSYRAASALATQSVQANNKAPLPDIMKGILDTSSGVATMHGVSQSSVVEQMLAFHGKAGNLEAAEKLSDFMTKYSEAGNVDPALTGNLAGFTYQRAKAKGATDDEAIKTTKAIMGTFMSQAAERQIELSDYVTGAPSVLASASQVGDSKDFAKTLASASAIAQAAPGGGANSAAEAVTSLARLVDFLGDTKGKVEKATGVKTKYDMNGVQQIRPFEDVIPELYAATNADPVLLDDVGITVRSSRAFKGYRDTYIKGRDSLGKDASEADRRLAGAKAVREEIIASQKPGTSEAAITEQAAFRKEADPYAKLEAALTNLATNAIPPLTEAVKSFNQWMIDHKPGIDSVAETVTDVVNFAGEHGPVVTGAMVAGAYATAKIGGGALIDYIGAKLAVALGMKAAGAAGTAAAVEAGVAAPVVAGTGAALAGPALAATGAVLAAGYNLYKLVQEYKDYAAPEFGPDGKKAFNPGETVSVEYTDFVPPRDPVAPLGPVAPVDKTSPIGAKLDTATAAMIAAATAMSASAAAQNKAAASSPNRADSPSTASATSPGGRP